MILNASRTIAKECIFCENYAMYGPHGGFTSFLEHNLSAAWPELDYKQKSLEQTLKIIPWIRSDEQVV